MINNKMSAVRVAMLGLTAAGAMTVSHQAAAIDVSASASVANMYFHRGRDLGNGDAAVSGDITASVGGFYGGVWGSSGDDVNGTEYDLYAGYGLELGGISLDASVWNYVYPTSDGGADEVGDLTEVIVSAGLGPVSFTYYDNVAGDTSYEYYTLGAEFGSFSALVGYADPEEETDLGFDHDYTHLDFSYAYNENLSFTVSKVLDVDDEAMDDGSYIWDDDTLFVVSYSLPIK